MYKRQSLNKEDGEITFQGWNIKNPLLLISAELENYFEDENISDLEIIETKEMAFSCSRYFEGSDAKDEGFVYWLFYHDTWRKGFGKCTNFKIKFKRTSINSEIK